MVRDPGGFPRIAPEYTGEPEPRALPRTPGEWEQVQPSSLPPEERGDPDWPTPPRRMPDPDPRG